MKGIYVIFILLGIALIGGVYYLFFSETAKKKKEIKRILAARLSTVTAFNSVGIPYTADILKSKTLIELQAIK